MGVNEDAFFPTNLHTSHWKSEDVTNLFKNQTVKFFLDGEYGKRKKKK